ncbi:NADPH-dependent FMN reductase [Curvibacter sp. APW13]|uniref:NADPH-dependent FMN reductase n=1 Tax=Curvibacter sp. APW13 TaxID=3077236 RepID=UPI0028DF44BD|nr:NADPH-dependent FMN reductase [Curvibacter sp. APW13]MDT8990266.1 NADPH-dependent FMN reductase [Curvibacter sp. APW13]
MSVLLVAGSPSEHSRSAALLGEVEQRLKLRGIATDKLFIRDLSPQALLLANVSHPTVSAAIDQVARAEAIVVSTPVYKAAYSGVLKVFLDLLPQTALKGKHVLPLATGGSPNHMLALDYALRPVLQSLGADHILPGVYAIDAQVVILPDGGTQLHADISRRIDDSTNTLIAEVYRKVPSVAARFAPVPFSQVRCSV